MIINTNVSAQQTSQMLSDSSARLAKSLTRLSSGSKIISPEDDAAGRLRAQWPLEVKMERADFVIYNGGTIEMVSEQLDRVLKTFLGDY